MDQRVQFIRATVTGQDDIGADELGTPSTVGTFWSNVQYGAGREFQIASQRWAETQIVFKIRRQPGVSILQTDDAIWDDKVWDIVGVSGIGTRDNFWTIAAKYLMEAADPASGLTWDEATQTWIATTETWDEM